VIFKIGDAVVHPFRGAGVVIGLEELQQQGAVISYYRIKLLDHAQTHLLIPVKDAESIGLRHVTPAAQLPEIWQVLGETPQALPTQRKLRYKLLRDKLRTGNILQIAASVRDIAWWEWQEEGLSAEEKRLYRKNLLFLASELAAVQHIPLADAEVEIRARLNEALPLPENPDSTTVNGE